MEITKEQVLELKSSGNWKVSDRLKKWFPEAFKVELEVGKVYKFKEKNRFMFKFAGKYSIRENSGSYGFNMAGKWFENLGVSQDDVYQEATTEEWESALIKEAKKRGYKNGNYKCLDLPNCTEEVVNDFFYENKDLWHGVSGRGNLIFDNGVWAEIIKTISKEDAEKQLGCKII